MDPAMGFEIYIVLIFVLAVFYASKPNNKLFVIPYEVHQVPSPALPIFLIYLPFSLDLYLTISLVDPMVPFPLLLKPLLIALVVHA